MAVYLNECVSSRVILLIIPSELVKAVDSI